MQLTRIFAAWLVLVLSGFSQEQSVVSVIVPDVGDGSGVIVSDDGPSTFAGWYNGRILTAAHVVEQPRKDVGLKFRNGRTAKTCHVIAVDHTSDIAIIAAVIPVGIKPVKIMADANRGDRLKIDGQKTLCDATASMTNDGKLFVDAVIVPGDSGGAVFNQKNELVGIVSGGWFWLSVKEKDQAKTWPCRAAGRSLMESILKGKK